MNPTKEQWKKIFDVASKIEKRHSNINQAYKVLQEAVAPDNYPLILENYGIQSFFEGLEIVFDDVKEDISYYLYECTGSSNRICTYKDKEYNANNLDEYIQFLLDYRNGE